MCVQYWVIFQRILDYFHYIFKHETTCMRGRNLKKITIEKNTIDSFIPASGIPRESSCTSRWWGLNKGTSEKNSAEPDGEQPISILTDPEVHGWHSAERQCIAIPALGSWLPSPSHVSLPEVFLSFSVLLLFISFFKNVLLSIVFLGALHSLLNRTFRKIS